MGQSGQSGPSGQSDQLLTNWDVHPVRVWLGGLRLGLVEIIGSCPTSQLGSRPQLVTD